MVWYHEINFLFNLIVPPSLWHLYIEKLLTKCEEWFLCITKKMKNGKNVSLRFLFLFERLDSPNEEEEINVKINKREKINYQELI